MTEEQKRRIEENKRKALDKRHQASNNEANKAIPCPRAQPNRPQVSVMGPSKAMSASSVSARPAVGPTKSLSAPSSSKPVECVFSLLEGGKFKAVSGFSDALVSAFKATKTGFYNAKDRTWWGIS